MKIRKCRDKIVELAMLETLVQWYGKDVPIMAGGYTLVDGTLVFTFFYDTDDLRDPDNEPSATQTFTDKLLKFGKDMDTVYYPPNKYYNEISPFKRKMITLDD